VRSKAVGVTAAMIAAVILSSIAVFAQAGSQPSHSRAVSGRTSAREAAQGGLAEVKLGQLAQSEGSSQAVKDFGQRMVTDYSKANDQLKSAASQANITLPDQPDELCLADAPDPGRASSARSPDVPESLRIATRPLASESGKSAIVVF
jgi:putative membrane protein